MNYCTEESVSIFANQNGSTWDTVSDSRQLQILLAATLQIENYHKVPREDVDTPWLFGDEWIERAAIEQCLFLIVGYDVIISRELGAAYTSGELDDGVKIAFPNGKDLTRSVSNLINQVISKNPIAQSAGQGTFQRS